jgi:FG-GAP repeat
VPRRPLALGIGLALAAPLAFLASPASAATVPAKPYDFNGDGFPEQAIGAPGLTVKGHAGAGGVVVLPGSATGLSLTEQVISQSSKHVAGSSEDGDAFGAALASADFDRDGYADLAVGQPSETHAGTSDAGAVTILYGSAQGLSGTRSTQFAEPKGSSKYADFGAVLAVGDLDGNGYPDLAVGAPGDDQDDSDPTEDLPPSGTVTVLFSHKSGLSTKHSHRIKRLKKHDYQYGGALAVGDVDGDGDAELVVAASGAGDEDGLGTDGAVDYCATTSKGVGTCRRLAAGEAYAGITALAVGNTSGSSRAEIVVGVPSTDDDLDPGSVQILSLTGGSKLGVSGSFVVTQEAAGVPGSSGNGGESFGASVALGDLDRDGYADLVIGAPGLPAGGRLYAGRVVLVRGAAGGFATRGNTAYDLATPGVPGDPAYDDAFGRSVGLLDHDADGHPDLTVGAPEANSEAGQVTLLAGSPTSFTTAGARTVSLTSLDVSGGSGGRFGRAVGGSAGPTG